MTGSPLLWMAGLTCILGGAIAGDALGSSPVIDRSTAETFYQSHDYPPADLERGRSLPDHYPLVTKRGVVPVAQLSDRGLFSQARYRRLEAFVHYPAVFEEAGPGHSFIDDQAVQPRAAVAEPSPPLELSQGPAQLSRQAEIIDVPATLAMR